MSKFTNISERYGEQVEVTVDDYKQLNPSGKFEQFDEQIVEHNDGGYVVVAVKQD